MSIDSPNTELTPSTNSTSTEDFNYIDTYVEFLAEVVLKFDNAIPEIKDRQHKELQQHKHIEVVFQRFVPILHFIWADPIPNLPRATSDKYAYQFIKEINPPPPKA